MNLIKINNAQLVTAILFLSTIIVRSEMVDGRIDIVAVVSGPVTKTSDGFLDWKQTTDPYKEYFGNQFKIGRSKTMLAIVQDTASNSTGQVLVTEKVVLMLTDDVKLFNKSLDEWQGIIHHNYREPQDTRIWNSYKLYLNQAFRAMDEIIFSHDDDNRAKVVIAVSAYGTNEFDETIKAAKKLCDRGVYIYVAAPSDTKSAPTAYLDACWQEENLFFFISNNEKTSRKDALLQIHKKLILDMCGWHSMCRYESGSSGKCVSDVWQSKSYIDDQGQCDRAKPTLACNQDDCQKTCDTKFPWEKALPNCNNVTCGSAGIRRVDESAIRIRDASVKKKLKDHCPHEFVCPPCPTARIATRITTQVDQVTTESDDIATQAMQVATETTETSNTVEWAIGLVVFVVLLVIITIIAVAVIYKKRRAKEKVHEANLRSNIELATSQLTKTINASIIHGSKDAGIDAATGVDLSVAEVTKKPSTKTPGSIKVHKPVKKMIKQSIKMKSQESVKKPIKSKGCSIKSTAAAKNVQKK